MFKISPAVNDYSSFPLAEARPSQGKVATSETPATKLFLQLLVALILNLAIVPPSFCQTDAEKNESAKTTQKLPAWQQREKLEAKLATSLDAVIKKCRSQNLKATTDSLQSFLIPRDPERQYIFLPPENVVTEHPLLKSIPDEIHEDIETILNDHANSLFALAKSEAQKENATFAYKSLNEVLFFSPNHQLVRTALGHRLNKETNSWRVKSDRLKIRLATKPNKELHWPAKSYYTASTNHFQVVSRASEEQTRFLAKRLETWHDVWRQVFFEYYNRPINLQRWLKGTSKPTPSRRKHSVVFFANHQDYVAQLESSIPGVAGSTGFYNDGEKTSYFYASTDSTIHDTWRHELTHQLFQESRQSIRGPFDKQFLWLGEGIAMYFESLVDHGEYFTVGGFDSRRLQYARLRRLKEQFSIPIEELSQWDRQQFQSSRDIAKIYSQSAGFTHYLMDADRGTMRKPLVEFFQLSYKGRLKPGTFEKLIGKSYQEIENGYDEFLKVEPNDLRYLSGPETRRELELIGLSLNDQTLAPISKFKRLKWIDLSGCDVQGDKLKPLIECNDLSQLFLTGAIVDYDAAKWIAEMPIQEVDLAGTNISSPGIEALSESTTLSTINLTATGLRDEQLLELGRMKQLRSLSVTRTKISSAGAHQFQANRPEVNLIVQ